MLSRQLPASTKTVYECWTVIYRRPRRETQSLLRCLGCKLWDASTTVAPGEVVAAVPQTHFAQTELAAVVDDARSRYEPLTLVSPDYDGHLERRLRRLDGTVQDELYALIRDRTSHASNAFRRREYKLVVLLGVPGCEMTDAGYVSRAKRWTELSGLESESAKSAAAAAPPSGSLSSWLSWGLGWGCGGMRRSRDRKASSHVEYRVILRGSEVKTNDAGWSVYDRYTQPWKLADETELATTKERGHGYPTLLD